MAVIPPGQEMLTELAFSLVRKWHNQQQSAATGKVS